MFIHTTDPILAKFAEVFKQYVAERHGMSADISVSDVKMTADMHSWQASVEIVFDIQHVRPVTPEFKPSEKGPDQL